jgi:hypothetical protein
MSTLRASLLGVILLSAIGAAFTDSGKNSESGLGSTSEQNAKPRIDPGDQAIRKWILELGDEDFSVREAATKSLVKIGPGAMPAILKAAESNVAEIKKRAREIAAQIEKAAIMNLEALGADLQRQGDGVIRVVVFSKVKPSRFTDSDFENLLGLPELATLTLQNVPLTDAGMVRVGRLKHLKTLRLQNTLVSDEGLKQLQGLVNLETFAFHSSVSNGSGLRHLKTSFRMRSIAASGSQISDRGIADAISGLKELDRLESLELDDTGISDETLRNLAQLRSLVKLSLRKTNITDSGLEILKRLHRLSFLDLSSTGVTEKGLVHIVELRELVELYLNNTPRFNLDALKALQAMPKLRTLAVCGGGLPVKEAMNLISRPVPPSFGIVRNINKKEGTLTYEVMYPTEFHDQIVSRTAGKTWKEMNTRMNKDIVVTKCSFKEVGVYDGAGKAIGPEIAAQRIAPGATILVARDGKMVHADYLRVVNPNALIVVPHHPGLTKTLIDGDQ